MRAVSTVVALLLAVSLAACGAATESGPRGAPSATAATVQVTNNNWSDMVIYLIRSSTRIRLGTVTSMNTARFQLPGAVASSGMSIHLLADPIGSNEGYVTPALQVTPGRQIDLTLQNHLSISSVTVW